MPTSLFSHEPNARTFHAGDVIFEAGSTGKAMYAVQSGEIDICLGETVVDTQLIAHE